VLREQAVDLADRLSHALDYARTADQLPYRQLVALAVHGDHDENLGALARAHGLHKEGRAQPDPAVLREFDDLGTRGLLGIRGDDGVVRSPAGLYGGSAMMDFPYGQGRLTEVGTTLHDLMRLQD
jgi:hypothetical protein